MPRAIVQLIFFVPDFVNSPLKRVTNSVFIDVLSEKVSREIGYIATLADIAYSIKVYESSGIKFKFKGYNDKLDHFIKAFFVILKSIVEQGLDAD
jgi:secreted Zn-dependent insulinase-like peptidase